MRKSFIFLLFLTLIGNAMALAKTYTYKLVEPKQKSRFHDIDSIVTATDCHEILSILQKHAITPDTRDLSRIYDKNVVDYYKFFEVYYSEGDSLLSLEVPHFIHLPHDYTIKVRATDLPRQNNYLINIPEIWRYSLCTNSRTYLMQDFISQEFEETNDIINLEGTPTVRLNYLYEVNGTCWTFAIKDGEIKGAFITFEYGDGPPNPTWDLINNCFVQSEYFIKQQELSIGQTQNSD